MCQIWCFYHKSHNSVIFLHQSAGLRVSEVFKGFKVHDFEYLLRSKKLHFEIEFMSLEMCHLLLTSKNY